MEVWIGRDGERHGPYQEADVRQWLRSGQVNPDDLGWFDGMRDWQPLRTLFPADIPAPEPAPTPSVPPMPPSSPTPAWSTAPVSSAPAVAADFAGFWQRFGAWVIDLVVLFVPMMVVFYATGGLDAYRHLLEQMSSGAANMESALLEYSKATQPAMIGTTLMGYLYYVFFEASKWQATPGKIALRLHVTDIHGQRLTLGRSAARNAVRILNAVNGLWVVTVASYVTVAFTQRKQGIHDLLASTLVLNGRPNVAPVRAAPKDDGAFDA